MGGFSLSKLATSAGLGFPWAPLGAALIACVLGLVVGLPALRIRGTQLAVVTLALGLAFEQAVFSNTSLSGVFGAVVPPPLLPGLDLSVRGGLDTARLGFGVLCLIVLTLAAWAVANLTRSGTGRRMLAVRSNERVSASVGISVTATKLTGFGLSAFIAGLGGALIGYSYGSVSVASFTALTGLAWLMLAYLGGITSIGGALTAGTLAAIGCVAMLALIAGTVSYLHMHLLVELHGQPGWVATLTPLSVDGMIVAASTTLLADSRSGGRGGFLPWRCWWWAAPRAWPPTEPSPSRQQQAASSRRGRRSR